MDNAETGRDLAQLLRENAMAISTRLERKFVEEYPQARANELSVDLVHRWTMSWIEALAHALEEGNADLAVHRGDFGRVVAERDEELSRFASSLATTLFLARHIAPLIYFYAQDWGYEGEGPAMVRHFEGLIRDILRAHCNDYMEDVGRPGALARRWDFLSGLESDIRPEMTPGQKHRPVGIPGDGAMSKKAQGIWEGGALTNREKDVLEQLVSGRSNGEIAASLGVAQNTVKNHVSRIFDKFGVGSRVELLAAIVEKGDRC